MVLGNPRHTQSPRSGKSARRLREEFHTTTTRHSARARDDARGVRARGARARCAEPRARVRGDVVSPHGVHFRERGQRRHEKRSLGVVRRDGVVRAQGVAVRRPRHSDRGPGARRGPHRQGHGGPASGRRGSACGEIQDTPRLGSHAIGASPGPRNRKKTKKRRLRSRRLRFSFPRRAR